MSTNFVKFKLTASPEMSEEYNFGVANTFMEMNMSKFKYVQGVWTVDMSSLKLVNPEFIGAYHDLAMYLMSKKMTEIKIKDAQEKATTAFLNGLASMKKDAHLSVEDHVKNTERVYKMIFENFFKKEISSLTPIFEPKDWNYKHPDFIELATFFDDLLTLNFLINDVKD